MNCPVCNIPLINIMFENQSLDKCNKCHGVWLAKSELLNQVNGLISNNKIRYQSVKEYVRQSTDRTTLNKRLIKCPVCNINTHEFNFAYDSNVFLDKCPSCDGIWADKGEMISIAEHIKGNPTMNELTNSIADELNPKYGTFINFIIKTQWYIFFILSSFYLGLTLVTGGLEAFFKIFIYIIVIFFLIMYSNEVGSLTGIRFGRFFGPVITGTTPGYIIKGFVWFVFLLPFILFFLNKLFQ